MGTVDLIKGSWDRALHEMFRRASRSILISSPYFTAEGAAVLYDATPFRAGEPVSLSFLTDLSPRNIWQGATDPEAFKAVRTRFDQLRLVHLPRLHSKVYVADDREAIVASANLTGGGVHRNHEYGVHISDEGLAGNVARDLEELAKLGATVGLGDLDLYCALSHNVRDTYRKAMRSATRKAKREFAQAKRKAEDELVRLRLAGGAMHTVFAETIRYLLNRYGPLRTVEIHPMIQALHPDLCDDGIDRVIDGKHFGKKWKHAVRTAQQQLKKRDEVVLQEDRWALTGAGR